MEERKQFTMYESMYKALQRIRSKAARADAYDAICAYALYQTEPELEQMSEATAIAFDLIRPILDSARKKAANGKQHGSKTETNDKQTGSKPGTNNKQQRNKPGTNRKQTANEKEGEKEREREKENENENEKENEIENEIEREGETEGKSLPDAPPLSAQEQFALFWEAYPNKADRDEAWAEWQSLEPEGETLARIRQGLEDWKKSGQWLSDGGSFIPAAARWLRKRRWEAAPAQGKQPVPKGASGQLGQAELEAIQRVLREG